MSSVPGTGRGGNPKGSLVVEPRWRRRGQTWSGHAHGGPSGLRAGGVGLGHKYCLCLRCSSALRLMWQSIL